MVALCLTSVALARATERHSLGNSEIRDLPRVNGRDIRVMVGLPYTYASAPSKRYPVLYICDGYWDFTLVNGLYGNLLYDKAIPEFIIVGLSYPGKDPRYDSLRRHDYTPVPEPNDPKALASGHAKEFLDILRKSIIPFVQKEYRADTSWRALGGNSLGGLFALYAAFESPDLFQGILAPSPAVVYGNGWLLQREVEFAASGQKLPTRLYLSTTDAEWPDYSAAIRRFHDSLESHRLPGLEMKWRIIDGERHAGTKAESYNRGLRHLFAPLAPDPSEK